MINDFKDEQALQLVDKVLVTNIKFDQKQKINRGLIWTPRFRQFIFPKTIYSLPRNYLLTEV